MALGQENIGALNFFEDQSDPSRTFDVFQTRVADVSDANLFNLQSQYGTAVLPALQWIEMIKTGQRQYDPYNPEDVDLAMQYDEIAQVEWLPSTKEIAAQVLSPFVKSTGAGIGQAFTDPYLQTASVPTKIFEGVKEGILPGGQLPSRQVAKAQATARDLVESDNLTNLGLDRLEQSVVDPRQTLPKETPKLTLKEKTDLGFDPKVRIAQPSPSAPPPIESGNVSRAFVNEPALYSGKTTTAAAGQTAPLLVPESTYGSRLKSRATPGTSDFSQGMSGAAGAAAGDFVINLAMGVKPTRAAESAAKTAAGYYIGWILGGPAGAFLGQTFADPAFKAVEKVGKKTEKELKRAGKKLEKAAKSVICNELERQGLMTRRQVMISYKFTHQHLSDQHERGYHLWAIAVVNQMRQGRMVKFWHHIATHRANEIEHFYGLKEKPDYLGKLYRLALEPVCWMIGAFCTPNENWEKLYVKGK